MLNVLYIVSTLQKSGPTNQLFNLINNLDRERFEPYLITLSPEPNDSRWADFEKIGVRLTSLKLSRIQGLFFAKRKLNAFLEKLQPDLIHTQGIRADSLLSSLDTKTSWVMTARNFPPEDYLTKFGKLKGNLMVYQHFKAMKKCSYIAACSKTIQAKLKSVNIISTAIQNGVVFPKQTNKREMANEFEKPIFISVGSLIPRKNMSFIISAFNLYRANNKGSLLILGDGFELESLKTAAGENIHLLGNVNNVNEYLLASDVFLSSSLSEGLPNTVLEALSCGIPCLLSDIESHKEIQSEYSTACQTFPLNEGIETLSQTMVDFISSVDKSTKNEAETVAQEKFSAEIMSNNYQEFYLKALNNHV